MIWNLCIHYLGLLTPSTSRLRPYHITAYLCFFCEQAILCLRPLKPHEALPCFWSELLWRDICLQPHIGLLAIYESVCLARIEILRLRTCSLQRIVVFAYLLEYFKSFTTGGLLISKIVIFSISTIFLKTCLDSWHQQRFEKFRVAVSNVLTVSNHLTETMHMTIQIYLILDSQIFGVGRHWPSSRAKRSSILQVLGVLCRCNRDTTFALDARVPDAIQSFKLIKPLEELSTIFIIRLFYQLVECILCRPLAWRVCLVTIFMPTFEPVELVLDQNLTIVDLFTWNFDVYMLVTQWT